MVKFGRCPSGISQWAKPPHEMNGPLVSGHVNDVNMEDIEPCLEDTLVLRESVRRKRSRADVSIPGKRCVF